jgi:hypothetical protein
MIQGDEGSAIPENVFEVIEGALSEAGDEGKTAKLMLGGNPNFASGRTLQRVHAQQRTLSRRHDHWRPGMVREFKHQARRLRARAWPRLSLEAREAEAIATRWRRSTARTARSMTCACVVSFPAAADDVVIPWEWANRARNGPCPSLIRLPIRSPWSCDPVARRRRGDCDWSLPSRALLQAMGFQERHDLDNARHQRGARGRVAGSGYARA